MKDPKKDDKKLKTDIINKEDSILVEKIQYNRENSPEQNGEDF